jgi:hypothetical protein
MFMLACSRILGVHIHTYMFEQSFCVHFLIKQELRADSPVTAGVLVKVTLRQGIQLFNEISVMGPECKSLLSYKISRKDCP